MRRLTICSALVVLLLMITCVSHSATKQPKTGDSLPQFNLSVPANPAHQSYLGLIANDTFTLPQIKAEVLIIEIFSMY